MGHVYRATNVEIDRAVAIKVLRTEHAQTPQIVERFLREARAANIVRHPNVVDVVDVGRDGDGSPFIVQELLTGEDLSKYVERRGGKLTLEEIDELILPVVDAVAEAHARGVVHRDLKPENIFIAQQGRRRIPKLLDFGISKLRVPNIKLTEVGTMMGTPAYMAPEQVQGARDADPRADVWALGIMIFELVSGRLPFPAEDAPALFVAIATKDVPPLTHFVPDVPASLARVVARCVRRSVEERYPSASELSRDLRHVFEGAEIEPTQRRSLPPPRAPLEVPELALDFRAPPPPRPAATTVKGPPTPDVLGKTEVHFGGPPPPSSAKVVAGPELGAPPPRSAPRTPAAPPPPSSRAAPLELGVAPTPGARRPDAARLASPPRPIPGRADAALIVSFAVVLVAALIVMVLLTTFLDRAEGWPILAVLMKPTPTMSLLVQGGLAACALAIGGSAVRTGAKAWRGDIAGGKPSALFQAALAGALFFAAQELARTAW